MKVLQLTISNFRGFGTLTLKPEGHVVVFGVPGGGRSDLAEAIARVLDESTLRRRAASEMDFHKRDVTTPATIEIALGDLGDALQQTFIDELEVWSHEKHEVLPELEEPEEIDLPTHEFVVRLKYRIDWIEDEERADEVVYFPKRSDEGASAFQRVRRSQLEALQFVRLNPRERVLDLGSQGTFRALVEDSEGTQFAEGIRDYIQAMNDQAASFIDKDQVKKALETIVNPISGALRAEGREVKDIVRMIPEGGAIAGILRSLTPSLDLVDGAGHLPIYRHRSTLAAVIRLAEALVAISAGGTVLVADDFAEGLDAPTATHAASLFRSSGGQVWLLSRASIIADVFEPGEIFRLGIQPSGIRVVHQARVANNKSERIAWKHWQRNVLPALSYEATGIVEGPNDRQTLNAASVRRLRDEGTPPPGAVSISIIDAGHAGSGGSTGVPKLASLAKSMGIWTVGIIDWDKADADKVLAESLAACDCVIRLPDGFAIEKLLIEGIETEVLRSAIVEVIAVAGLNVPWDVKALPDADLRKRAVEVIKAPGGLHETYVEALPDGLTPPGVARLIDTLVEAVRERKTGHIQL